MSIGDIIHGHVNELLNTNEDLCKLRIKICKKCPLYLDRLGGVCNSKLWLNVLTGDVSSYEKPGYKRGCGCRLLPKTRLENGKCPLGKW